MKKYILYSILLILAIILIFTLGNNISRIISSKPIPQSTFKIIGQEKSYNAKVFSYSWAGDYKYAESSVVGIPFNVITVPANSKIEISFDNPPKEEGVLDRIFEENINDSESSGKYNRIIEVPAKDGTYTYYYTGSWHEGSVAYIFRIKVPQS